MSSCWIVFLSVRSTIPWYQTQRSCCRTSSNTSGPLGTSDLPATTIYITKKKKKKKNIINFEKKKSKVPLWWRCGGACGAS